MRTIDNINLDKKIVLLREDLNVPIKNGQITNMARILAILPSLKELLAKGTGIIILSHLGRPTPDQIKSDYSLEPFASKLSKQLNLHVRFEKNWLEGVQCKPAEIVLCENIRFIKGEIENDIQLAQKLAALADVYVMDAFACSHRAHASTEGVIQYAKDAVAGPLLSAELQALASILEQPKSPLLVIVGGAKVSSKFQVLAHLIPKIDMLILGGGIANTMLSAQGYNIGASLYDPNLLYEAKQLFDLAKMHQTKIYLPTDVCVAKTLSESTNVEIKMLYDVQSDDQILDIGPKTQAHYDKLIMRAQTILWNGPVSAFEYVPFISGTRAIAHSIAKSQAFSVAGGGDTLSAIDQFGVRDKISYISTGGGALLEYLKGQVLPSIKALRNRG